MANAEIVTLSRSLEAATTDDHFSQEIECECMVCDLPLGSRHEPLEWRVTLHFPGPYPAPGNSDMLLCTHCKDDWVHGEWAEPDNNFNVVRCERA